MTVSPACFGSVSNILDESVPFVFYLPQSRRIPLRYLDYTLLRMISKKRGLCSSVLHVTMNVLSIVQ